ncbi:MAG TPA: hypothetical protein VLI43_14690 [Gemmatimonadaceae bacterium]|nr:hypothetical protein [Gemmatimonadaceae bacterium]
MKWGCLIATLLGAMPLAARAQSAPPISIDSAKAAFAEATSLCSADAGKLWGVSLCGPIMFVDAPSRSIVANESDGKGVLAPKDGVFVEVMPADRNIANTAVEWQGRKWTQMLWPLPNDARLRSTLIMHELFHRIQDRLALPPQTSGDNAHLDELKGRYYMLLEWRALARALESRDDADRRDAARDALLFRAERYRIYVRAAAQEHALEQNEGLAEYTGVRLGNPTSELRTRMALHDLSAHAGDATIVRSFAYATGPAYGLLLDRYAPRWRKELETGAGLNVLLERALHVATLGYSDRFTAARAARYGGRALHAAEAERDAKRQELLAIDRRKFVDGPVLTLVFRHMNVQFNPQNLQPLGDAGTVYPTIRVTDDWGVIEGTNGALMRPDWSALVVPAPASTTGSSIAGDGWTLELKPGWKIVPDARRGDYTLAPPE